MPISHVRSGFFPDPGTCGRGRDKWPLSAAARPEEKMGRFSPSADTVKETPERTGIRWTTVVGLLMAGVLAAGCTMAPKKLTLIDDTRQFPAGAIIATDAGDEISFEELVARLKSARIVYVGETHSRAIDHGVQLRILRALHEAGVEIVVGMEMFDTDYDPVLAAWSHGELDEEKFLEKTHWYANWRYRFSLYREILEYIRDNRIRLVGLNIPFHIPPKIRTGGIDSLLPDDRKYLPAKIDTGNAAHRAYVEKVYGQHRFRGGGNFEFFYEAQCAWEDAMAESVVRKLGDATMVVLVGNGHIIKKFGIPDRTFSRNGAPFLTVYLESTGHEAERSFGDFIWVTPADDPNRAE
jgi:uncharacterized iron-regulated protein